MVSLGVLDGGTLDAGGIAERLGKPLLIVPLDAGVIERVVAQVLAWVRERPVTTLNVAGPRESRRPGSYRLTRALLDAVAQTSIIEERERHEQLEARMAAALTSRAGRGRRDSVGGGVGDRPREARCAPPCSARMIRPA